MSSPPTAEVACLCVKSFNTSRRLKPHIIHISQAVRSFELPTSPGVPLRTPRLLPSSTPPIVAESIAAPVYEQNLSPTSQRLINLFHSFTRPFANAQHGPSKARSDPSELAHDAQTLAVVPQLIRPHAQLSLRTRWGFCTKRLENSQSCPPNFAPGVEVSRARARSSEVVYGGVTEELAGHVAASLTQRSMSFTQQGKSLAGTALLSVSVF